MPAGILMKSPLAMRRANHPVQRRLAAHLAGFLLTENSFIVRRAGDPPGTPSILNTRITVEHIAQYFKEGWGVTEIERDLNLLTRAEIEGAIQYYLNHRAEIERDMRRSRELYDQHAPKNFRAEVFKPSEVLGDHVELKKVAARLFGRAQGYVYMDGLAGRDIAGQEGPRVIPGERFFVAV